MKCPICQHDDLQMTVREGVEIDYCPTCRGVWLDRGELDTIITRTMATVDPSLNDERRQGGQFDRVRRTYDGDFGRRSKPKAAAKQDKAKRKKRGSFLGDLFDFDL